MSERKINVRRAEYFVYVAGSNMVPPHHHNYYHCIFVIKGKGKMTLNNRSLELLPNHFYITSPGSTHSFGSNGSTLMLIDTKFEIIDEELEQKVLSFPCDIDTKDAPIYSILQRTRKELAEQKLHYQHIVSMYLEELLFHLDRCLVSSLKPALLKSIERDSTLLTAIAYINGNMDREITLQELADAVHLEKAYFSKRFKDMMGCTPIKYARIIRIEKAKDYLKSPDHTVTQVAEMCGFKNIHHFSNTFSKIVGMSPNEYKKNKL